MTGIYSIQIPVQLARFAASARQLVTKYETNQLARALDTWIILKHDSVPSLIQDWNRQKSRILQICKCSESIFRHRLKILARMQLITYDRSRIQLCSWKQLEKILQIDCREKFTIQYNVNDGQKIYQWIFATEIKANQESQDSAAIKRVNKNPEVKMQITAALIASGADRNQLKNDSYFLSMMKAAYLSDFIQASDIHDILIRIRPDNNRSVEGIAAAWNARHPMTATYWKKRLQAAGIIDVGKLQIQSRDRVRNQFCRVKWLPGSKQTFLSLCDQITVLQPWIASNLIAA